VPQDAAKTLLSPFLEQYPDITIKKPSKGTILFVDINSWSKIEEMKQQLLTIPGLSDPIVILKEIISSS
jgi:hypothetical protein